jgi:hypothetical protein
MSSKQPRALALTGFVALVLGLAACGGSNESGGAAATAPSSTKPAHDLRINSELEKRVTDDWAKALADPADANYAEGVTVTHVQCTPQAGTSRSTCRIALSNGQSKKFDYIVAGDGTSLERAEPIG